MPNKKAVELVCYITTAAKQNCTIEIHANVIDLLRQTEAVIKIIHSESAIIDENIKQQMVEAAAIYDIVFGIEAATNVKVLAAKAETLSDGSSISGNGLKMPLDFHAEVLFSPVDRSKKTAEGAIGLLVGMKKMDLTNVGAIGKSNVSIAIRVGLPLSAPLTRK